MLDAHVFLHPQRAEIEEQMKALGCAGGDEEEADGDGGGAPAGEELSPDWMHTNAVAYDAELDLILLSCPEWNEVYVIDHSTTTDQARGHSGGRYGRGGDLLWRWGHPRHYGAGTDADRRLHYQHNPPWVVGEEGSRSILVFDNGSARPGDYSVIELALPLEPGKAFAREAGRAFGPAEPMWSYEDRGKFYSPFISGAQRLPNGNTLVCEGARGRVFEVTRAGEVVWDYYNPLGGEIAPSGQGGNAPPQSLFRALRYGADHPALAGRGL